MPFPRLVPAPRSIASCLLPLTLAACGASPGAAVEPTPATYADATGHARDATCHEPGATVDALVVDLAAEERVELEAAMRDGVAVVAYDCTGLRLLRECRAQGAYGFKGVTLKEQVVTLESKDEVRANLPAFGDARLGAALDQGKTLDVALAMVGKMRSGRPNVTRGELEGDCGGATHFVRGATVGAFVMAQGTRGATAASAELFGIGASGASGSQRRIENKDGRVEACRGAKRDDVTAPADCTAVLRLELRALRDGAAPVPSVPIEVDACPAGLVFRDGKCAAAIAGSPQLCTYGDEPECRAQCDAGHAGSCAYLGAMLWDQQGKEADAARALEKGCAGGNVSACHNLGFAHYMGSGVAKDAARARALFTQGCDGGFAVSCAGLGLLHEEGDGVPKDEAMAARQYELACRGGDQEYGCPFLARMLADGRGIAKDASRARSLLEAACAAGSRNGCTLRKRLP